MKTKDFIESFNRGNQQERARLIVSNGLQDPSQHLIAPMPANAPFDSVHILGYVKIRAGIWYATMRDGRKVLMSAFRLHSSGSATFREFVKFAHQNNFTDGIREKFIDAFDHLVSPLCADN